MTNPTRIGRYEIIERVGRGGMGVLYRGRDTVLDREVAIKVMATEFDADSDDTARPRFYREARAAAKLQHRNIVTVFEFGEEDHTPFIVMEFLRGQDLSKRMRSEPPLTLEEKLDIVADLCTGLHFAHEQGVVHRDVKPANIWILTDGSIKLLDFGIAKFASSTMTRQGSVLGSVSYMAPEQVVGGEVDGRADVFSAGVVLYELLTGQKPFDGDSATAVLARIMDERPVSLDVFGPDVPRPLVAAVAKALQKDREKRYRHAADFGADLRLVRSALSAFEPMTMEIELTRAMGEAGAPTILAEPVPSADPAGGVQLLTSSSTLPIPAPPASNKWLIPAIAALVLAVGGAAIYWMQGRTPAPAAQEQANEAQPPAAPQSPPAVSAGQPSAKQGAASAVVPAAERPHRSSVPRPGGASDASPSDSSAGAAATPADPPRAAPPAPVAPGADVILTGSYGFEVYSSGRLLSGPDTEHRVRVTGRQPLQLKAPEFFLDATVVVDTSTRHVAAPELGRLSLRIPEVCSATIAGRNLGEPPYAELQIAAGNHRVQMSCPDGSTRNVPILIRPGEVRKETIAK